MMSNINIAHYDDGKQKWQSHEVYLKEKDFYNTEYDINSHDIFTVIGYGETKEEALKDFKRKIEYLFKELKALETMIFETDVLENNMIEVDYAGNEVK